MHSRRDWFMPTLNSADPRAWRTDTIDDPAAWYHPLSEGTLATLDRTVRAWRADPRPVTDLRPDDALRAAAADDARRILAALEDGRGFVVVTPGPAGRFP